MDPVNLEILLKELEPLAKQDGIISKDEQDLLDQVKVNIESFIEEYKRAWEDNRLSKDEKKKLTKLWDNIYEKSLESAKKDNNVTAEEFQILIQVLKTIVMKK